MSRINVENLTIWHFDILTIFHHTFPPYCSITLDKLMNCRAGYIFFKHTAVSPPALTCFSRQAGLIGTSSSPSPSTTWQLDQSGIKEFANSNTCCPGVEDQWQGRAPSDIHNTQDRRETMALQILAWNKATKHLRVGSEHRDTYLVWQAEGRPGTSVALVA